MDMLDHFLAKFYQRRIQGTSEIYDISRDSKGLLLLYVLIVAVLAEDGEMTSETFESLRECLRMASTELVSRLRSAVSLCTIVHEFPFVRFECSMNQLTLQDVCDGVTARNNSNNMALEIVQAEHFFGSTYRVKLAESPSV